MPFSYITQSQAETSLAQRLYDSTQQLYPSDELRLYITEALQAFNTFANYYRQEFVFQTTPGGTWYDLTSQTYTLRRFTVTDQSILNLIQYHLLEPQTTTYPLTWTGSKQFTISDILNAIQQMRDECLSDSGCTIVEKLYPAIVGRTFLDDVVIDVRRVCWIPATGVSFTPTTPGPFLPLVFSLLAAEFSPTSSSSFGYTNNCLLPADLWGNQSFEPGFVQAVPGYPLTYRRSTEPPVSFDVDIQPAVPGQYDVLTVNTGLPLTDQSATTLNVPTDWCWVVKWGALAQLLGRESLATSSMRADYALMRYKQGVALMQTAPALLAGRINNVPAMVDAMSNGDFYDANWQALTPGQPQKIYYAGLNMVGLAPIPDTFGPYSVTASVLANMPLPAFDSDFIQVGREDLSAILDYAQHIAMFKVGGAEFTASLPLYQNFIRHCQLHNSKLNAMSMYLEWLDGRGKEDEKADPRFSKPDPVTVNNG